MVYLIEQKMPYSRTIGLKVGYTERNIDERLTEYRTHNPWVILLDTKNGTKEDEKSYHENMKLISEVFNRCGCSEWFEVVDRKIIKEIEENGFNGLDKVIKELL